MAENPNSGKNKDQTGNSLPDDIEKAAENAAHKADDAVDNLLDRASSAASSALYSAEDAVSHVGEAIADAGSQLLHETGEVVDKAKDAVADAGSGIAEDAGILVDGAGKAINTAGKSIANAGESAYESGARLVDSAGHVLNEAESAVAGAGSKLIDGAGNVIHDAGATVGAVAAGTGIAAAKTGTAAKKTAAAAITKTGHAIDDTSKSAQRAAAKAARDAKALSDRVADRADNIKWLVIALLVLLIAAAAIYSYVTKTSARRAADAQNLVFKSAMEMQGKPEADALAAFGKAAQDFKGLPAGQQARLYQFAYGFNTGKYAEAEQSAREFIKDYPGSVMVNRASLALGQSLMQQDKLDGAISTFRDLVAKNDPETLAEAKLALAQALEKNAEQVKGQPEEYRRRLELAEQEYSDILSRANISIPSQRGYWPQSVTLPADYALVQIKDKLAGHTHGIPSAMESAMETEAPVSQRDLEGAGVVRPPSAAAAGGAGSGISSSAGEDASGVAAAIAAAAAAAAEKALSATDAVKDAVTDAASDTVNKARELLEGEGGEGSSSGESTAEKARIMMERALHKENLQSAAESLTHSPATGHATQTGESIAEKARRAMERALAGTPEAASSTSTSAGSTGAALIGAAEAMTTDSGAVRTEVSLPLQTQVVASPSAGVVVTESSSTPDTITVTEEVSHEGEEYVKASEAGLAPAGHLVITTEVGQEVEVVSEDPVIE